jgi:hypothetical protein
MTTRKRPWWGIAVVVALTVAFALLFVPLSAPGGGASADCGSAVERGAVYSSLRDGGTPLAFVSAADYGRIQECDALRHRNAALGWTLVAISVIAVAIIGLRRRRTS